MAYGPRPGTPADGAVRRGDSKWYCTATYLCRFYRTTASYDDVQTTVYRLDIVARAHSHARDGEGGVRAGGDHASRLTADVDIALRKGAVTSMRRAIIRRRRWRLFRGVSSGGIICQPSRSCGLARCHGKPLWLVA